MDFDSPIVVHVHELYLYQGILTKASFHVSVVVMKHRGIIDTV